MYSFHKKSAVNLETCRPEVNNLELPWQLQEPPLLQRLKSNISKYLLILFILGAFSFVVIMSFGDGTSTKRMLLNFSIADSWQATVALKEKIFNDKVDTEVKSGTPDK